MSNWILFTAQTTTEAVTEAAESASSGGINWVFISAIVLVAGLLVIGFFAGFFRMLLGTMALFLAVIGTYIFGGSIADRVADSGIGTSVEKRIEEFVNKNIPNMPSEDDITAQNEAIEKLPLPERITKHIITHNNRATYEQLGVDKFPTFLTKFTTNLVISAAVYVILFLVLLIALHLLIYLLDITSKLPIINGLNHLAGALLGLIYAVAILWIFFILVSAFPTVDFFAKCQKMIMENNLLGTMYNNNLLMRLLMDVKFF